jgi:glycosyltransferase involved in cell wall biosynthesis
MRILWLSRAPWAAGGYSNQTELFVPRLKAAGHDIAMVCSWGIVSCMFEWQEIPVYPTPLSDPYGGSVVAAHYQDWRADLLISLHDINSGIDIVEIKTQQEFVKWALWFPVDSEPLPPIFLDSLKLVEERLVFSRFGERMANNSGVAVRYVPHGIDTKAFHPTPRAAARAKLGWPQDIFIAGMVAANAGPRKAFQQNISGFAKFHKKHPDSFLYLHSQSITDVGLNLEAICSRQGLKIGKDVAFCDLYLDLIGVPATQMCTLYNAMDVLLLVTMGEGFGLPIVEAQACGTPVIVGDWSSMSDLKFAGWTVDKSESTKWRLATESDWHMPDANAIADRLERAYEASKDETLTRNLREAARKGAEQYDVDLVTRQYWLPLLTEFEKKYC